MALAPVAYLLYTRVMRHSPEHPDWPGRDRFVLSCGHASMLLYSIAAPDRLRRLARRPQELPPARLADRRPPRVRPRAGDRDHHRAARPGHLHRRRHGARRAHARRALRPTARLVDHFTYVIASDGDLEEGIASEASLARRPPRPRPPDRLLRRQPHLDRGRHRARLLRGRRQALRGLRLARAEPRRGPRARHASRRPSSAAQDVTDRPSLIIVRTHIAPGSPNKQDTHEAHGSPLGEEEIRLTKQVYGWPERGAVLRPRRGARALPRVRRARPRAVRAEWQERVRGLPRAPGEAAELERILARRLPDGLGRRRAEEGPGRGHDRHPQGLARGDPVGGRAGARAGRRLGRPRALDADADQRRRQRRGRRATAGRNLHFGIREHGMGAIVNGLDAAGLPRLRRRLPDLQRLHEGARSGSPRSCASRRSSCSRTTRSASARTARRTSRSSSSRRCARRRTSTSCGPAGFNETALAWRHALRQTDRPTALALSRQGLPVWDPAGVPDDAIERGAYVLRDSEAASRS